MSGLRKNKCIMTKLSKLTSKFLLQQTEMDHRISYTVLKSKICFDVSYNYNLQLNFIQGGPKKRPIVFQDLITALVIDIFARNFQR